MAKLSTKRQFAKEPLDLADVAQLLWAANGKIGADAVTSATKRFMPSAGGLYPLEVFLVAGDKGVKDLDAGVYHYNWKDHALKLVHKGDKRAELAMAAYGQTWLARAPALIVITAVFPRTLVKYGKRGVNYVYMEAGGSNQNIYLQAPGLGINTAAVGAFNNKLLHQRLKLPKQVKPVLIVAIGNIRRPSPQKGGGDAPEGNVSKKEESEVKEEKSR
jgi:SagB-type dehydrogenase family enzyme